MSAKHDVMMQIMRSVDIDDFDESDLADIEACFLENHDECHEALLDAIEDFRCSGEDTGLETEFSRSYESEHVATMLDNGKWVGWCYWHGGGKHGDSSSMPWLDGIEYLDVEEKEVTTIERYFKRKLKEIDP